MSRLGKWVTNLLLNDATGALNREIDDERTQYPYDLNSGWWSYGASQARTSILLGVSSHHFKPETLIITNDLATANKLFFYDGNASRTAFTLVIKASDTIIIDKERLRGMYFLSGVFVSNLDSQLQIRIGGKLILSIPNTNV